MRFTGTGTFDAGFIFDTHVNSNAGIDVSKMEHALPKGTNFNTAIGGTPATREELVHCFTQDGRIVGFHALLNAVGSGTSIVFDLKKNGTSILGAGTVTITNSDTSGQTYDGTLTASPTACVAGDRISILMTVGSSTGAQGAFAWAEIIEDTATS
jgi:hypothetical protein